MPEDDYDHAYVRLGMKKPTQADGEINDDGVIDTKDTDAAFSLWQWDHGWVARASL